MSLRKLCFYALLAATAACAAVVKFAPQLEEFRARNTNISPHRSSLAGELDQKSETLPAAFLPVQSRSAKNLGAGKLLVASRSLGDPLFAKTVILLARYDSHGVVGLILNRRTDVPLSRALDNLKAAKDRSDPVYLGGPLETPAVFALFQSPAKLDGADHIFDSVYLITSKPLFEKTISARPDPGVFHVYLGYAGWTEEQLQQEVELGAWFIFSADTSTVFNTDPDSLWPRMIRKTELEMAQRNEESTVALLFSCHPERALFAK